MPVVEAMACGPPVISSTTTSLPEICGDAALLVDPQQTEAIAAAMLQLVDDETLQERSLPGFGTWRVATHGSWQPNSPGGFWNEPKRSPTETFVLNSGNNPLFFSASPPMSGGAANWSCGKCGQAA